LGIPSAEIEVARSPLAMRAESREVPAGNATAAEAPAEDAGRALTAASGDSEPQTEPIAPPVPANASGAAAAVPTAMRMEDLGIERFVPPTYPRGAQRRGVTGFVDLEFDVNPNGRTSSIEVVRAVPGDVFDKNAAEAVSQWRFAPRDDTVRASVTLRFEIAR
jgi:protein TonB